jgi:hypothetical protein
MLPLVSLMWFCMRAEKTYIGLGFELVSETQWCRED